jgi:hypothetical protein
MAGAIRHLRWSSDFNSKNANIGGEQERMLDAAAQSLCYRSCLLKT